MKIYVSPEEVANAKEMDLLTYLSLAAPQELVRRGNNHYTTRSHDSIDISNGLWKRWSTGDAGKTAVDYLIKVEKLSFQDAVQSVNKVKGFQSLDVFVQEVRAAKPQKKFNLPERNHNNIRAIQYLENRGIHPDVIHYCIQKNYLFEEKKYHNVVFVGYENVQAKYAFRRGTSGVDFKREALGSDKKYGFGITENRNSKVLHVYECAIDLLSYCSLGRLVNANWTQDFHLSQGGVSSGSKSGNIGAALQEFIDKHSDIQKVYLRYDNDQTGYEAAITTQRVLQQKYGIKTEIKLPQQGKDYNEFMQNVLNEVKGKIESCKIFSLPVAETRINKSRRAAR